MIRRLAHRLARAILQLGGNLLAWSLAKEIERAQQQLVERSKAERQEHLANCVECRGAAALGIFASERKQVPRC